MSTRHRKVLAIGLTAEEFQIVDRYLSPGGLEVDRFPSVHGGLELASTLALDAILVRFPLEEMELRHFLDRLREPRNRSRFSPTVIVTADAHRKTAEDFVGRGANRVVALDAEAHTLLEVVMGVIFVAPRRVVEFPARFHPEKSAPGQSVACRVRNASISGALFETPERPEKGEKVYFRFEMPSIERPVVGVGEVVRHTDDEREDVSGVGVRFLSFAGSSKTILESYLHSLEEAG